MLAELTQEFSDRVEGREAFGFDIEFDLGEDGCIHVAGTDEPIEISNQSADADATFVISATDLADLLSGALPPMSAYIQGKMKVEGDLAKAMQFGQLFG